MIATRSMGWLLVVLVGACGGRMVGGVGDGQHGNADGSAGVGATTRGGDSATGCAFSPVDGGHATNPLPPGGPTPGHTGLPPSGSSGGASPTEPGAPEGGAALLSSGGDGGGPPESAAAGQAGEGATTGGSCHFEYLGNWLRCEGDDDLDWLRNVPNHSLADCTKACLAQPDCVAVVDYYWLNLPALGCVLDVSRCAHPGPNAWAQEDGGKEFRKVCN